MRIILLLTFLVFSSSKALTQYALILTSGDTIKTNSYEKESIFIIYGKEGKKKLRILRSKVDRIWDLTKPYEIGLIQNDNTLIFEKVIDFDSLSQETIHERSRNWIYTGFADVDNDKVQISSSLIAFDFYVNFSNEYQYGYYEQACRIDLQGSRVRFRITNFNRVVPIYGMKMSDLHKRAFKKAGETEADLLKKIYRKSGDLKRPDLKEAIENKLNSLLSNYISYVNGEDDW